MDAYIRKYKFLIATFIFILNYLFKVYAAGENGFWFDECFSVYVGGDTIGNIIRSSQSNDPNPPLYLIVLHYWMYIFGDSEFGVRLLSVVSSSLAASALFLFSLRFFNWQTSVFASILFFTSNELYYYAQEARTFGLLIPFVIISNYYYLNIYKDPKWRYALFLGLCNAVIFYLHLVASFLVIAQLLSAPLFCLQVRKADNRNRTLHFSKKIFWNYFAAMCVFGLAVIPWAGRLLNLAANEGKDFWITKANFEDYKYCIYVLFNSKETFRVFAVSFICMIFYLFLRRKKARTDFDIKIFLYCFIAGPLLMSGIYLVGTVVPLFIVRYVLFTFLGFILLYCYLFSLIRMQIAAKLILFCMLGILVFDGIVFPRQPFFEYNKAMVFLKKIQTSDTFIANDVQNVFSYYYDKKIFHITPATTQKDSLKARNVLMIDDYKWVHSEELSRYRHIYFVSSFSVYDGDNYMERGLEKRFILTNRIEIYKGIIIRHYYNPAYKEKGSVRT